MSDRETLDRMNDAGSFYDRYVHLYDLVFKINRYRHSIERYLRDNPVPVSAGGRILDAGCGTGLLTLALMRVLERPARITALDLSLSSVEKTRRAVRENDAGGKHEVTFVQANVLALPFPDATFELVATSGALEYVSLREGFGELARVLTPGGYLLHLPVKPSLASRLLELLFRFKTHPPREVAENTSRYFQIIEHYRFPPLDPIGWTKTAVLAQKIS